MGVDGVEIRKGSKRVLKAIVGMHPVDAMASLETVIMNMIADLAKDLDDANRGLDSVIGDIRIGLQMRFPGTRQ